MKISDEILEKAIKEAVKQGVLPKYADIDTYIKNRDSMRAVLEASLGHCTQLQDCA